MGEGQKNTPYRQNLDEEFIERREKVKEEIGLCGQEQWKRRENEIEKWRYQHIYIYMRASSPQWNIFIKSLPLELR